MKPDIYRFAGEFPLPDITISPLTDRGIGTMQGRYSGSPLARTAFRDAIEGAPTDSDELVYTDMDPARTVDLAWLLDRFMDITGGISPGRPTVKGAGLTSNSAGPFSAKPPTSLKSS